MSETELAEATLLDAVAGRVRTSQVEEVARAGLPADLVATEQSVWKRLTPGRNPWPQVAAFDERVAGLEQRQAAVADELRELRERELAAPARDHERLAEWELGDRKGLRPEPELPAIRERIELLQAEWEGLTRAAARVLDEKGEYVEKHRGRLVKEADGHTERAHRRYLELIDALAEARADLFATRRAAVWARLFPAEQSARDVADTFAGGRRRPLEAMGLAAAVAAERVLDGLRADADWLREAATPEQHAEMESRDVRHDRGRAYWTDTEEGQEWQRAERQRALERLRNPR